MYLKRLKDLREDHDLSQEKVSKLLKITRPQYSLYETGKRDIHVDLLRILAKYYKTSIDYIVGDTDVLKRYPEKKWDYKVISFFILYTKTTLFFFVWIYIINLE